MAKTKNNRFDIDFFEFYFLLETCVPNVPIARTMFWYKAIDKYYHVLTKDERERIWEWMNRNDSFIKGIRDENEDCILFYDRYNPFNQYLVKTLFKGKEDEVECFKYKDRYHTSRNTSINEDFIKEIKKIEP
jgi:hypothetical protein